MEHYFFLVLNTIDSVFDALQVLVDVSDVDGDVTDAQHHGAPVILDA